VLFNPAGAPVTVDLTWAELGLQGGHATVRDLWKRADLGTFTSSYSVTVAPDASTMLLIEGEELAPPSGESSLGDVPLKFVSNTGGALQKNQNFRGAALTIGGHSYSKGLGANAASIVLLHLGGACQSFTADVGIDDAAPGQGAAIFEVWADGTKLASSDVMRGGMPARNLTVPLTGKNELKLSVALSGLDWKDAHADWGDARISCR